MTRLTDRHDLIADLEAGCKPPADWRIGVEHEVFAFRRSDHAPAPYTGPQGVAALLEGLRTAGFCPVREGGALIGLEGERGANYSLEPGGQFEYAGPPMADVGAVHRDLSARMAAAARVAEGLGLGLLPLGFAPHWRTAQMPATPMSRFDIMRAYMPRVGRHGLDMMHRTCSLQVNLDFASEADMVTKVRVALALQPVAAALVANAPFAEGAPAGPPSHRGWIWLDVDAERTGLPAFVFDGSMGFERWVDYALDVPMYSVRRGGGHINLTGRSFRDFLAGRLAELPGERPTTEDWRAHLNTLMPEARLKRYLELRGADSGPPAQAAALAAFWTGLLYDGVALADAWALVRNWTWAERESLRRQAPARGLATPFRGTTLRETARTAVAIAREGLKRRARGDTPCEEGWLAPLAEAAETGRVPADRWLDAYAGPWRGDLSPLYRAGHHSLAEGDPPPTPRGRAGLS